MMTETNNSFFCSRSLGNRLDEFIHFGIALLITIFKVRISSFLFRFSHSAIEIINFVHKAKYNLQEIRERVVKSWQVIFILSWREYKNRHLYALIVSMGKNFLKKNIPSKKLKHASSHIKR